MKTLASADPAELRRILRGLRLPSWMVTPDVERTAWLNSVIAQLWPSVCRMAKDWVDENMDELLRQSSPGWIRSIKMTRFSLGDVPPAIDGVKAFDGARPGGGGRRDSITLEFDFGWAGEQEAHLTVQPVPKYLKIPLPGGAGGPLSKLDVFNLVLVKVGVERLIVSGRVRVTLGPLSSTPPFFGAVQVSLVGQPQFDFGLDAYGGDLSLLPGLEGWIHSMLRDAVFAPYTLPERLVIPMTDDPSLLQDRPIGMLQVCAVEARNVPRMDLLSKSDPYLELFTRVKRRLRTQVVDDDDHPVWDERFAFPVYSIQQELTAILFDYDLLSADDEIGRLVIPLEELPPDVEIDAWFPIVTPEEERERAKVARKRKHHLRRGSKKKKTKKDEEEAKAKVGEEEPAADRPGGGRTDSATGAREAASDRKGDVVRVARGDAGDDDRRDERMGHSSAKAVPLDGRARGENNGGAARESAKGVSGDQLASGAEGASGGQPASGARNASSDKLASGAASTSNRSSATVESRVGGGFVARTSAPPAPLGTSRPSSTSSSAEPPESPTQHRSRPWSLFFPSRSSTSSAPSTLRRGAASPGAYRGPLPDDRPEAASPPPVSESHAETSESSEVVIRRYDDGHYRKQPLGLDALRRARQMDETDDWSVGKASARSSTLSPRGNAPGEEGNGALPSPRFATRDGALPPPGFAARDGNLSSPGPAERDGTLSPSGPVERAETLPVPGSARVRHAVGGGVLVDTARSSAGDASWPRDPSRLSSESPRSWGTAGARGAGNGAANGGGRTAGSARRTASAPNGGDGASASAPGGAPSSAASTPRGAAEAAGKGASETAPPPSSSAAAADATAQHEDGAPKPTRSQPSTLELPAGGRLVVPPPASSPRCSHLSAQGFRHGAASAMRGVANVASGGGLMHASGPCEVRLRLRFTPYDGAEVKKIQDRLNAGVPAREVLDQVPQSLREGLTGGLLRVRILKAVDLARTPFHRNAGLRSVRVVVSFAGDTKKTAAIGGNKTTYPFDQLLEFVAFGTAIDRSSEVEIEVWDVRFRDYLLGSAVIPFARLVHGDVNDTLSLQGPHSRGKGVVVVEASWVSALSVAFQGGG